MKLLFKLLTVSALLTACAAVSLTAFAEGFSSEADTVTFAKTPYDKKYVAIDWNTAESDDAGVPSVYGEYVILPSINRLVKRDEKNGEVKGTAELNEKVNKTCKGAVTGNVLIQPTRTMLCAVSLDDMTVTASRRFGEIVTDVAVKDGRCYFGYGDGDKYKFACADINAGFETVFDYGADAPPTSPARLDEYIVFGAGNKLVVLDGEKIAENELGAEITHVFAGKYAVFMTCADGTLRKVRLDENGNIEDGNIETCGLDGELTAPAGIDNHIYVSSSEGFYVIDGLNMEITKKFPELKNASAPFVTAGNGVRAYIAVPHEDSGGDSWYLYSVLDTDEALTARELVKIIDYTGGRAAVSANGEMYFRDGRGQVWAISEAKTSFFMMILKIVLTLAMIVMLLIIIRALVKKRLNKKPTDI